MRAAEIRISEGSRSIKGAKRVASSETYTAIWQMVDGLEQRRLMRGNGYQAIQELTAIAREIVKEYSNIVEEYCSR
jgi:molybdenum-dependent DNA-binding transcriptional regulator ModE